MRRSDSPRKRRWTPIPRRNRHRPWFGHVGEPRPGLSPRRRSAGPIVLHDPPPDEPSTPPAATVLGQPRPFDRPTVPVLRASARGHAASPARASAPEPLSVPVPKAGAPVVALRHDQTPAPAHEPVVRQFDARVSAERAGASIVRHPWPELPPPTVRHDVDLDGAVRAWERERRLDREQAGL